MSGAEAPRALVIGGSLGGLFAATLLRQIGWRVDVFERSPNDLDSRGGGIVLQPQVLEVFHRLGVDVRQDLGVGSAYRVVFRPDGAIQSKVFAPQTQTSWSQIYTTLKAAFGMEGYHQGRTFVRVKQGSGDQRVAAHFDDGSVETGDLLIGADGGNSFVRQQLWPKATPTYAGYVAWRGLLPEDSMPLASREMLRGDFGFASNKGSHILGYLVPGEHNDLRVDHRLYNWVWYRIVDDRLLSEIMTDRNGDRRDHAVPEGLLADKWLAYLDHEAAALLPLPFKDVVQATAHPFVQAIRDLASDQMVNGRVILLGDAASIPRPHTAASTAKAAVNALALADALQSSRGDVDAALSRWEPEQIQLGKYLLRQGKEAGDFLLFRPGRT